MSTTTLKLPEELKQRIATAAEASGKSPHAFMVDALAAQTSLAERRAAFVEAAHVAEQEVAECGLVYDADEVCSYLQDKAQGKRARRPKAKSSKRRDPTGILAARLAGCRAAD